MKIDFVFNLYSSNTNHDRKKYELKSQRRIHIFLFLGFNGQCNGTTAHNTTAAYATADFTTAIHAG